MYNLKEDIARLINYLKPFIGLIIPKVFKT